jgi:hypothetical protein
LDEPIREKRERRARLAARALARIDAFAAAVAAEQRERVDDVALLEPSPALAGTSAHGATSSSEAR